MAKVRAKSIRVSSIGATAISGYRWFDETIDGLDERITAVETGKVATAELEKYVPSEKLRIETCYLSWQMQLLEYRALAKAYDELFKTMNAAAGLYVGRTLSKNEKEQLKEILRRRSAIETEIEDVDEEMKTLDERYKFNRGCE